MSPAVYATKRQLIEALIAPEDSVLDVGFFGQGIRPDSPDWVHGLLRARAREVYGVDLAFEEEKLPGPAPHYFKASAEDFKLGRTFSVIFAADLIEHLSNFGNFLGVAKAHLTPGGRLVLTTPNTFNLFAIAEKISKGEPTVNPDHTCYFNVSTLRTLFEKNDWHLEEVGFLYTLGELHRESWKKKILNGLYGLLSRFTPKFLETLVIVARPS